MDNGLFGFMHDDSILVCNSSNLVCNSSSCMSHLQVYALRSRLAPRVHAQSNQVPATTYVPGNVAMYPSRGRQPAKVSIELILRASGTHKFVAAAAAASLWS